MSLFDDSVSSHKKELFVVAAGEGMKTLVESAHRPVALEQRYWLRVRYKGQRQSSVLKKTIITTIIIASSATRAVQRCVA
jgi:hypothetical protein